MNLHHVKDKMDRATNIDLTQVGIIFGSSVGNE